jgi:hypothetical protein
MGRIRIFQLRKVVESMWGYKAAAQTADLAGRTAQEARDMAVQALAKMDSHINECTRRYEQQIQRDAEFRAQYRQDVVSINQSLAAGFEIVHQRVSSSKRTVNVLVAAIGSWIIVSLITAIIFISYHGMPWQHL